MQFGFSGAIAETVLNSFSKIGARKSLKLHKIFSKTSNSGTVSFHLAPVY